MRLRRTCVSICVSIETLRVDLRGRNTHGNSAGVPVERQVLSGGK